MIKVIWKKIPGYPGYQASDEGHIREKDSKRILNEFFNGHKHDPYLAVSIKNKPTMIHHLVCLAFYGDPGEGYEANHKDGNKLNPIPTNLEWLTHSENVIHAYETKLNRSSQHIDVTDLRTGDVIHLRSLGHFASHFGLGESFNKSILAPRNQPWLGHYQIDLDPGFKAADNNNWLIDVKDYTTDRVHSGVSLMAAHKLTGLLRKTVRLRLVNKSLELTNGCVVKFSTDNRPWPVYKNNEIMHSVAEFRRAALKVKNVYGLIDCFDYRTNTLHVGVTLNFLEKELKLGRGTVKRLVNRKMLKLINGCIVQKHGESIPFPEVSKEDLYRSLEEAVNRSVNNHRRHK
jgi:hypothetical protein